MVGRLWLIGGTQESAELSRGLAANQVPCVVTVISASARRLYPQSEHLWVHVGSLTAREMAAFLRRWEIYAVLDASHPFAGEISQLAIATCQIHQLPYLRYERPTVSSPSPLMNPVPSLDVLLTTAPAANERILLLVGSRWLGRFQPWQQQATLFTRILPTQNALVAATAAGFSCDRIIALRPPIGDPLEAALWRHWQITRVITKASGPPGEQTKARTSEKLNVPMDVIQRPKIRYPQQTADLQAAIQWSVSINKI